MTLRSIDIKNSAGVFLSVFGLVAALNVFLFSLPGIGAGVWPQSESAIAALNFYGALCACGLLVLASGKNAYIIKHFALHPYVLFPLGIAVLSLILTPLYDLPLRHIIGSARTGEGTALWFCWAILILTTLVCFRLKTGRRIIIAAGILSFVITFFLSMAHIKLQFPITPYHFPDHMAFSLLCLIPVFWPWLTKRYSFAVSALILFVPVNGLLFLSENKIAMVYGFLGMGFFILVWLIKRLSFKSKNRISMAALAAVPILVITGLLILAHLPEEIGFYRFYKYYDIMTVYSRGHLVNTALSPIAENFTAFFTGNGWGTYAETMTRYLPVDWLDLTRVGQQWDGITIDHFHSHNMIIETLSGVGIFGALLLYMLMVSIPVFATNKQKFPAFLFAGGFVSISAFWFLLPLNIPFAALGLAACARTNSVTGVKKPPVIPVLLGAIAITLLTGVITLSTALAGKNYIPDSLEITDTKDNCPMDYRDHGAGGLQLSKLMIGRIRYMIAENEALQKKDEPDRRRNIEREIKRLNHLFCQSEIYKSQNDTSLRFKIARILVRGEVLLGLADYIDKQTVAYYRAGWEDEIRQWLALAPSRTDQAVPFLLWHFIHGQEDKVSAIAGLIYKSNPEDPVSLWFRGLVLTGQKSSAAHGVTLMRKALENGIERVMPVDTALKAQLSAAPAH